MGEVYFGIDGNHRVSVARQEKFTTIETHVIEVKTPIPLTPDIQPDDLIIKAEYAELLEATHILNLNMRTLFNKTSVIVDKASANQSISKLVVEA